MTLDPKDYDPAHKHEPTFQAGEPASGAMPGWLNQPAPAPGPTALQRWGQRIAFLGIAIVAVAAAGGATWVALELYDRYGESEVVADSAQVHAAVSLAKPVPTAQAEALPFAEKRTPALPPLVMLPHDQAPKKELAAPAAPAAMAVAAPVAKEVAAPAKPAAVKKAAPEVKPALKAEVKPVLKPVVKPALKPEVKPALKPVAKAPAKPEVKAPAKPAVKAPLAPAKKPVDKDAAAPKAAHRCQPGELARECEARNKH